MAKFVAYILVILSLLAAPAFASYCDLKSPNGDCAIGAKADPGKAKKGDVGLNGNHCCCASAAHHGYFPPAQAHLLHPLVAKLRLTLRASEFPAAFGPAPLLEPPALS